MRISLNLATRPYLELRPVLARLRAAAVVLFVLALPMLLVIRVAETRARLAEAKVDQLRGNIAQLERAQAQARALTRQGPNAQVLAQAAFLNELFRRKSFAWTAAMSDLETTLPSGVQVQAIDPVVSPNGLVTIRMRVTGGRERAVDVVHNLERSRYFAAPHVVAEALANQNSGNQGRPGLTEIASPADVTFDILADYRPLPNSHPSSGRGRSKPSPGFAQAAPAAASQAQLTNPDPAPAPKASPKTQYHPSPPFANGGLPPIPPPLGERP